MKTVKILFLLTGLALSGSSFCSTAEAAPTTLEAQLNEADSQLEFLLLIESTDQSLTNGVYKRSLTLTLEAPEKKGNTLIFKTFLSKVWTGRLFSITVSCVSCCGIEISNFNKSYAFQKHNPEGSELLLEIICTPSSRKIESSAYIRLQEPTPTIMHGTELEEMNLALQTLKGTASVISSFSPQKGESIKKRLQRKLLQKRLEKASADTLLSHFGLAVGTKKTTTKKTTTKKTSKKKRRKKKKKK